MTTQDQVTVDATVAKALSAGLSPEDCKRLSAEQAAEAARRLIEISKGLRAAVQATP